MDPMMNNHDQVTVINNIPTSEFKNKEKGHPIEKIDDNTVIDIETANESDKWSEEWINVFLITVYMSNY